MSEILSIANRLVCTPGTSDHFAAHLNHLLAKSWTPGWEYDAFCLAGDAWGLDRIKARQRIARAAVLVTLGDLTDDLADGDVPTDEVHLAPTALLHLSQVASQWVAPELLAEACSAQHLELTTKEWTLERYLEVAEGVASAQFEGYLRVLWAGSNIRNRAATIGRSLGFAIHILTDAATTDPRLMTLPQSAQHVLVRQTIHNLDSLAWPRTGLGGVGRISARLALHAKRSLGLRSTHCKAVTDSQHAMVKSGTDGKFSNPST